MGKAMQLVCQKSAPDFAAHTGKKTPPLPAGLD
jgi:hypothetical protein